MLANAQGVTALGSIVDLLKPPDSWGIHLRKDRMKYHCGGKSSKGVVPASGKDHIPGTQNPLNS